MLQIRLAILTVILASANLGYGQQHQAGDTFSHPYLRHLNEAHARVPLQLQPPAVSMTDAQRRLVEAQRLVAQAEQELAQAAEEAAKAENKAKADLAAQAKAAQAKAAKLRDDAKAKEKAKLAAQVKAAQLRADAKAKEQERKRQDAIESATESASDIVENSEKEDETNLPDSENRSIESLPGPYQAAPYQTAPYQYQAVPPESMQHSSQGTWADFSDGVANSFGVMQNPYMNGVTTEIDCSPLNHSSNGGGINGVVTSKPRRLGARSLGNNGNGIIGNRQLGNRNLGNRIKATVNRTTQAVQRFRCGSAACNMVGGCNEPGGCQSIGVIGAIANRNANRPVGPVRNHIHQAITGHGQPNQGIMPQRTFAPMQARERTRANGPLLPNQPLRTLAQRIHCGSQSCLAAGGCNQVGGCGLLAPGHRIGDRLEGFRFRSAHSTRNPGTMMMWRGQTNTCTLPTLNDPIVTDRPSFTPASSVVGLGVGQVELGYTYLFNDDVHGSIKTHSYPETLLRYGVFCDWFELRLGWNTLDTDINGSDYNGAEDLQLGFKIGLTAQSGIRPEMALIHRMRVPTGSDFFSKDEVLNGLGLAYRWQLNDTLSFAGSTQFDRDIDPDSYDGFSLWAQSLMIGVNLTDRMAAYTEYFGLYPHSADYVRPQHFFNGGLTYLINNDLQWDIRYGVNLDDQNGEDFDNYFAGMGLSLRLR